MTCPSCGAPMRRVDVRVHGASSAVTSLQCTKCDRFEFEPESASTVLTELRESPLKIRQRVIKLSRGRLGLYLNANVVRSLSIEKGDEILVSVPDRKHILIELDG